MALTPIQALRAVVSSQQGVARDWHIDDLRQHELRYLADLALIESLAPQGTVLELGAAPCHMSALLKLSGIDAVGVDIQPQRVGDLIRAFGLDVRRCDIEREPLPFADGHFSGAMLCETFEHLRIDPAFVLSEIHRVLAPGAPLLLTTPNLYALPNLARLALGRSIADPAHEFGKLRTLGHMGHVREYSAREVVDFLQASGFAIDSLRYRFHANKRGRRAALLRIAYRLCPRRFHREIVIVARKQGDGPRLQPLGDPGSG
ncbi:class I SAM-dependent methyltransferase [Niveibacterium microcysteis]|uniref:Class I SAM-dependent methyltransferase n=1 Tax=Niveibacterium microcysteis TaxID=2811415 RepID=A0ABX7M527_9RHOO|nr:class I SAM-dependent methyltransferase [Niveibacterium microcysteis]QSI76845.1 class I SAM-dependent methyltransferase [Niveibacterium microcysteis]